MPNSVWGGLREPGKQKEERTPGQLPEFDPLQLLSQCHTLALPPPPSQDPLWALGGQQQQVTKSSAVVNNRV
ncbi:Kelch Repeat And Btb Domain-Containing Protein 4 [Manis pentadactyla]|nr:Kelch Repeat And Btb Domain-Containing Protein 4 [Manis pentadactyla]